MCFVFTRQKNVKQLADGNITNLEAMAYNTITSVNILPFDPYLKASLLWLQEINPQRKISDKYTKIYCKV